MYAFQILRSLDVFIGLKQMQDRAWRMSSA